MMVDDSMTAVEGERRVGANGKEERAAVRRHSKGFFLL